MYINTVITEKKENTFNTKCAVYFERAFCVYFHLFLMNSPTNSKCYKI